MIKGDLRGRRRGEEVTLQGEKRANEVKMYTKYTKKRKEVRYEKTKQRKGEEYRNWSQFPLPPPPTWLPPLVSVLCVLSVFSHLLQHLSA